MADAFATAQQDVEAQRRAANAAIAAGGSAGAAAFQQGQQQIEAARTAALNQALSEAAQRGQGDIGNVLSGIVNRPYSQLGAGLSSSAASHAADSAFMGARANDYFSQLGAAIPVSAQNLAASIAREKAKAAKALSDSELRTRLMGAGELTRNQDLADAAHTHHLYQVRINKAKQGISDIDKQLKAWRQGKSGAGNVDALQGMKAQLEAELATARTARAPITETLKSANLHPVEEYARQAGIDAGEDPARIAGLVKMPQPSAKQAYGAQPSIEDAARQAGVNSRALARITKPSGPNEATTHWEAIQSNAADYLKRGVPWASFYADMKRGLRGHPRTLKLAAAYWAPIFQARG
jgi:hypothetical protein